MPATRLVSFERRLQLAALARSATTERPIRISRTRTPQDFQIAVRNGMFPIVLFEAEADPDLLPDLVAQAKTHDASIVVIGDVGGLNRQMQLRESGAHCLLSEIPSHSRWQVLLDRLVEHSQLRLDPCGGFARA